MAYLVAALVLVGLLAALNLVFTTGVVRRLREHTTELAALRERGTFTGRSIAHPPGMRIGEFAATGVDGSPVSADGLGERALAGFFSPHCEPCKERLPEFVSYAAARPATDGAVLAVVVGDEHESAAVVDELRKVATVVLEAEEGPIQQAFGVTGFPAFVALADGRVAASDYNLAPVIEHDSAAAPA